MIRHVDRTRLWIGILMAGMALINTVFPKSFWLFPINHITWYGFPVVLIWTGLCIGLLFLRPLRFGRRMYWALAFLLMAAFFVFKTSYPTLHGDGEYGAGCATAWGGRSLRAFLPRMFSVFVHSLPEPPMCDLAQSAVLNNAMILANQVMGVFAIAIAAFLLWRWKAGYPTRAGLLVFIACSGPLAGAFGHYDSYASCMSVQLLWWGMVCRYPERRARPGYWGVLLPLTALAIWIHPLHVILPCYLLYLVWADRVVFRCAMPVKWRVATGALFCALLAAAPLLHDRRAFHSVITPLTWADYLGPMVWRYLHLKAGLFLLVALPAFVLYLFVLRCPARPGRPEAALVHTCRWVVPNGLLLCLFLAAGYGTGDEFLYGIVGAMAAGASVVLFVRCVRGPRRALIWPLAVVSLFLYAPKIAVYSGERIVDRFIRVYDEEWSLFNIDHSPSLHVGFFLPVNRESDRMRRVEVFRRGANTALPAWQRRRPDNLALAVAWAYEFGMNERGFEDLQRLLWDYPEYAVYLWRPNCMYTGRHADRAYPVLRRDSLWLLERYARAPSANPIYSELLDFLVQTIAADLPPPLERGDP